MVSDAILFVCKIHVPSMSLQYPRRVWESWVGAAVPVTWQVSPWLASQAKHQTCLVREEFSLKYDNGKNAIST